MAEGYGFRIMPVYAMVNNTWIRRPDIESVTYKGHHIMTVPAKLYPHPTDVRYTLEGMRQPDYYDREYKLRNWNLIIKNTPHINGIESKKIEALILENKLKQYGG